MSRTPLSAGDYIASNCSKCREMTNHTIVALVDEIPVKVKCNICNSEHKFRKPAAAKKVASPQKTPARRAKADPQAAGRAQWQELQASFSDSDALAYSMNETYKLRALIKHPTFGLGQVLEVTGTRKMTVLFEDGAKVLRCG